MKYRNYGNIGKVVSEIGFGVVDLNYLVNSFFLCYYNI